MGFMGLLYSLWSARQHQVCQLWLQVGSTCSVASCTLARVWHACYAWQLSMDCPGLRLACKASCCDAAAGIHVFQVLVACHCSASPQHASLSGLSNSQERQSPTGNPWCIPGRA